MTRREMILLGICLLLCLGWGGREKIHITERTEWRVEKQTQADSLSATAKELTDARTELKKRTKTTKRRVPVQLPNGQVAYMDEESSETFEESLTTIRQTYESKLEVLQQRNSELEARVHSKEIDIVRAGPRWGAFMDSPILTDIPALQNPTAYRAGGAMNFGPVSVIAHNPLRPEFAPKLALFVRF